MELKILSFNIRCTNDPDGHSIPERAPRVASILQKYAPDIVGMQEYHRRWEPSWDALSDPAYEELIVDRGDGEGNVLRWRRDRFQAVKKGHFWFADNPDAPATDWDEKYHKPRICAYAVLKDKSTDKIFTFMNVHYGFGSAGHIKNAKLLAVYARKLGGCPTVIAGDFNMQPETAGHQAMKANFLDVNEATARLTEPTFHGYGNRQGSLLDYCFVSSGVKPCAYALVTETFDGKYPSDHYGICMQLEI